VSIQILPKVWVSLIKVSNLFLQNRERRCVLDRTGALHHFQSTMIVRKWREVLYSYLKGRDISRRTVNLIARSSYEALPVDAGLGSD